MPTNAERQRRYRERHRRRLTQERVASRTRARARELLALAPHPACSCCGLERLTVLVVRDEKILCRNCDFEWSEFGLCVHSGVGTRLD